MGSSSFIWKSIDFDNSYRVVLLCHEFLKDLRSFIGQMFYAHSGKQYKICIHKKKKNEQCEFKKNTPD